jgi:hypothetical protein
MGVLGWNVLADNKMLVGTVTDHGYEGDFWTGDKDWEFNIKPKAGFESVAEGNDNGLVQCEIRTAIDSQNSEAAQFGELVGREVTVWGTWVTDISHGNKKEIHPLMLLLATVGESAMWKRVKIMVFSDHSPSFMVIPPRPSPPHRDQATHATFSLNFPLAPADDVLPIYSIVSEKNMSASRNFSIAGSGGDYNLNADINSGRGDNSGYYRGYVDLSYDTSHEPSYVGLFHSANTEHYGRFGWDTNSFFNEVVTRFNANTPLTNIRTYVVGGQREWAGTFENIGKPAYAQWYMSWDDFTNKYNELRSTMNLIDIETHVDDGIRYFTAVWHGKTNDDGWAIGDLNYVKLIAKQWDLPAVCLKTYLENGKRVWLAVFRQTGVPTEILFSLTWGQVLEIEQNDGKNIVHLEPYMDNGTRLWSMIVENAPRKTMLAWWQDKYLFAEKTQYYFDTWGLRLFDFCCPRGWM